MKTITRGAVYLAILIATIALVSLMRPSTIHGPRGIILPLKKPLATISVDQVRFYENIPKASQSLARINIEQHFSTASPKIEKSVLDYARQMAAKIGANGIYVSQFGRTNGGADVLSTYVFHAIAFKVKNS